MRKYVEMTAQLQSIYAAQEGVVENLAEAAIPMPPELHGPVGNDVVRSVDAAVVHLHRTCLIPALVMSYASLLSNGCYHKDVLGGHKRFGVRQTSQAASANLCAVQQFRLHVASHKLQEVVHDCALAAVRGLTPIQIARGLIADEPYVLDMLHLGAHLGAS